MSPRSLRSRLPLVLHGRLRPAEGHRLPDAQGAVLHPRGAPPRPCPSARARGEAVPAPDLRRRQCAWAPSLTHTHQSQLLQVAGVRLIPMIQFLDSMHCARTDWYRKRVFGVNRFVRWAPPFIPPVPACRCASSAAAIPRNRHRSPLRATALSVHPPCPPLAPPPRSDAAVPGLLHRGHARAGAAARPAAARDGRARRLRELPPRPRRARTLPARSARMAPAPPRPAPPPRRRSWCCQVKLRPRGEG